MPGVDPASADAVLRCSGKTKKGTPCKKRARNDGFCSDAHAEGAPAAGGRPSKLTREVQDKIVQLIGTGAFAAQAAVVAGVSEATFYRWMEAGADPQSEVQFREFREAVEEADARGEVFAAGVIRSALRSTIIHSPYCEAHWQHALAIAELDPEGPPPMRACGELDYKPDGTPVPTKIGCRTSPGSYQAALALLERRHPERWRRGEVRHHEGGTTNTNTNTSSVDLGPASRELVAQGLEEIRKAAGSS